MRFHGSGIPGSLFLTAAALQSNAEGLPCTFCPFGYEVQNPDAFVNETAGLTCSDLSDEMAASTEDISICSLYRLPFWLDYPDACGYCEVPPEDVSGVCTICADGSSPNADASTAIPGSFVTCGQLSYLLFETEAGTSNCTDVQSYAAISCDCPNEDNTNRCELCPGGLDDPALYSDGAEMTCGELVGYALFFLSDSDACDSGKMLAFSDCGCLLEANANPCELCPGGLEDQMLFSDVAELEMNCGELVEYVLPYSSDSEMCDSGKILAALGCGCPLEASADPCELCTGGLKYPTLFSDEAEMTCSELVDFALAISSDSEMCDSGKILAFTDCGCPYPLPPSYEDEPAPKKSASKKKSARKNKKSARKKEKSASKKKKSSKKNKAEKSRAKYKNENVFVLKSAKSKKAKKS